MTTLEQAARQALEALESAPLDHNSIKSRFFERRHNAITALRQALEQQPKQKPAAIVSSVVSAGNKGVRVRWLGGFPQIGNRLYSSPQPTHPSKPLTDAQIDSIMQPLTQNTAYSWRAFARAVEAAHGIGEKQ